MKTKIYTEDDFIRFDSHIRRWIEKLGLTEWNFDVQHEQIGENAQARCSYNNVSKNCIFKLTKVLEYSFGVIEDLNKLALHEVLHLAMADYTWLASQTKDEYSDASISHEHELINRLARVIIKD